MRWSDSASPSSMYLGGGGGCIGPWLRFWPSSRTSTSFRRRRMEHSWVIAGSLAHLRLVVGIPDGQSDVSAAQGKPLGAHRNVLPRCGVARIVGRLDSRRHGDPVFLA